MSSFVVCGSMIGDEGKGTLTDYITNKYNCLENVRYNGGSQASHTVMANNVTHKFSQLGSAKLNGCVDTYLSENTIVNPFNIITEAKAFRRETGLDVEDILSTIYISENAKLVTPYHTLLNKLRELSNKNNRIGSVGTGVSEVNRIYNESGIYIDAGDLVYGTYYHKLMELFEYAKKVFLKEKDNIDEKLLSKLITKEEIDNLTKDENKEYIYTCFKNLAESDLLNVIDNFDTFHKSDNNVVFEGSQGFLIDKDYGIKPNTTAMDTTNHYGVKLARNIFNDVKVIGAFSAYNSRHGMGILPTHDEYLQKRIKDLNQMPSYYQGYPTYGWFDTVLGRYSLKYNPVDEIFLSCLDRFSGIDEIKICDSYIYTGDVTEEFEEIFDYYIYGNKVIIKNILKPHDNLRKYLAKCIPWYIKVDGFNCDISNTLKYEDLPTSCHNYIDLLEFLLSKKITLIDVGPDRSQKLERVR